MHSIALTSHFNAVQANFAKEKSGATLALSHFSNEENLFEGFDLQAKE
jgi:hypothetical protein